MPAGSSATPATSRASLSGLRQGRRFVVAVLAAACVASVVLGPARAAPAAAVTGSVIGPIVSVSSSTFKLTTSVSPTGSSTVSYATSTPITEELAVKASDLKTGSCVQATGAKSSKGVVAASRITISAAVKGKCTTGLGNRGGQGGRPRGATGQNGPRPSGNSSQSSSGSPGSGNGSSRFPGGFAGGNFGFAFGKVTSIKKDELTVQGTLGGKKTITKVTVSSQTSLVEDAQVKGSAIREKLCAFVFGTSADKGVTVKAQTIRLTQPTANGCTGFQRPGGQGGNP